MNEKIYKDFTKEQLIREINIFLTRIKEDVSELKLLIKLYKEKDEKRI